LKVSELYLQTPAIHALRPALPAHRATRLGAAFSALAQSQGPGLVRCGLHPCLQHSSWCHGSQSGHSLCYRHWRADTEHSGQRPSSSESPYCGRRKALPGRTGPVLSPTWASTGLNTRFGHGVHLCLAAVAFGWDVRSSLGEGLYSAQDNLLTPSHGTARFVHCLPASVSSARVTGFGRYDIQVSGRPDNLGTSE
jgi:hypothetical protein